MKKADKKKKTQKVGKPDEVSKLKAENKRMKELIRGFTDEIEALRAKYNQTQEAQIEFLKAEVAGLERELTDERTQHKEALDDLYKEQRRELLLG